MMGSESRLRLSFVLQVIDYWGQRRALETNPPVADRQKLKAASLPHYA